jgi:HAD superfamily hydrolase (TIGR01509 family)
MPVTARFPEAVLWDMDGTIIDSEPYWMEAEGALVGRFGGTWSHEQAERMVGNGLETTAAILQEAGVDLPLPAIVDWLDAYVQDRIAEELPLRPGAVELLTELRDAGVPCALVTMSYEGMARRVAAALPEGVFAEIVAGDNVENPKPFPDAYELAARRLGVDVTRCVAFEDSVPGLTSAVASGAVAVGIPLYADLGPVEGGLRWTTLEGVTLERLRALEPVLQGSGRVAR